MPCNSDYLESSGKEIELSRVACLLDELNGKDKIDPSHWSGYHPLVYNKIVDRNALVSELCSRLQDVDISQCSLEMQIWWRDHQEADRKRLETELEEAKEKSERDAALAKLTPYERKLLGVG